MDNWLSVKIQLFLASGVSVRDVEAMNEAVGELSQNIAHATVNADLVATTEDRHTDIGNALVIHDL